MTCNGNCDQGRRCDCAESSKPAMEMLVVAPVLSILLTALCWWIVASIDMSPNDFVTAIADAVGGWL